MTKCCALGMTLSLVLEVRWMQPVRRETAKAAWASALVWFYFFSSAHLVDQFRCFVSAAGAVQ